MDIDVQEEEAEGMHHTRIIVYPEDASFAVINTVQFE